MCSLTSTGKWVLPLKSNSSTEQPCDYGQVNSPREPQVQTSSATKKEQCLPSLPPWDVPAQGPLTIVQGHFPLWGNSTGFQVAIVPGECRDEAGMVDGAYRPLLLILREVWPWKQQDIRKGSAHQHLSLEETPKAPIMRSSRATDSRAAVPHTVFGTH